MSALPPPCPVEGALRGETLSTPPLPPRVKGWRRLIDMSDSVRAGIERFHSRDQPLCKFIGAKESVYIGKECNSHRTGLGHQHGQKREVQRLLQSCFMTTCIVFLLQYFGWPYQPSSGLQMLLNLCSNHNII